MVRGGDGCHTKRGGGVMSISMRADGNEKIAMLASVVPCFSRWRELTSVHFLRPSLPRESSCRSGPYENPQIPTFPTEGRAPLMASSRNICCQDADTPPFLAFLRRCIVGHSSFLLLDHSQQHGTQHSTF